MPRLVAPMYFHVVSIKLEHASRPRGSALKLPVKSLGRLVMNIRLYSAVVVVGLLWKCLANVAEARSWVGHSDAEFGFTFTYPPDL